MSGIFVDQMQCNSSQESADEVYLIVFRGNTTPPFDSNVHVAGPGNFWDDFDDGENANQDISIALFRHDAVYVVMLVEEDSGRDIDTTALGLWKNMTDIAWKAAMLSLVAANKNPSEEPQRNAATKGIINAFLGAADATIRAPKDPDDIIGRPQRLAISPGEATVLTFKEEEEGKVVENGARYTVRFIVK